MVVVWSESGLPPDSIILSDSATHIKKNRSHRDSCPRRSGGSSHCSSSPRALIWPVASLQRMLLLLRDGAPPGAKPSGMGIHHAVPSKVGREPPQQLILTLLLGTGSAGVRFSPVIRRCAI